MTVSLSATAGLALECLYQHRLLSTSQLGGLLDIRSPRRAQELLADLAARGLADHVGQRDVAHRPMGMWFVTDRGADVVEAVANRGEPRRRVLTAEQAGGQLQAHTHAVNDVGLAFVRAARARADDDCGPLAWRHEIAHPIGSRRGQAVIADALLRYLHADGSKVGIHLRFLELDRATMPVDTLAEKIALYARLSRYGADDASEPLWRRHYPTFPALLIVLAGAERKALRRRLKTTIALCRSNPALDRGDISASLCLLDDLTERGPFAPIFSPIEPSDHPVDWLGAA